MLGSTERRLIMRVSIEAVPSFDARGMHSGHGHTAYPILAGMDGEENSAESAIRKIERAFKGTSYDRQVVNAPGVVEASCVWDNDPRYI